MDPSDNSPANRSPRSREILGPRPTPLKVRKDSHKIKKPPLPPPQQQHHQEAPPRAPVIIYTVSPKIIHTNPSDFMTIVQRLTGKTSSSSSSSLPPPSSSSTSATSTLAMRETTPFGALSDDNIPGGSISPAARYAAMEKANASLSSPEGRKQQLIMNQTNSELRFVEGIEMGHHHHQHQQERRIIERPSFFPAGILSPGPTSLPPISPSFFSPPPDPSALPFFNELSSILQASPSMPSPFSSLDLFNNFSDL